MAGTHQRQVAVCSTSKAFSCCDNQSCLQTRQTLKFKEGNFQQCHVLRSILREVKISMIGSTKAQIRLERRCRRRFRRRFFFHWWLRKISKHENSPSSITFREMLKSVSKFSGTIRQLTVKT